MNTLSSILSTKPQSLESIYATETPKPIDEYHLNMLTNFLKPAEHKHNHGETDFYNINAWEDETDIDLDNLGFDLIDFINEKPKVEIPQERLGFHLKLDKHDYEDWTREKSAKLKAEIEGLSQKQPKKIAPIQKNIKKFFFEDEAEVNSKSKDEFDEYDWDQSDIENLINDSPIKKKKKSYRAKKNKIIED